MAATQVSTAVTLTTTPGSPGQRSPLSGGGAAAMVAATTKGGAQLSFAERKSRGSGSASKPRPTVPPLVEGDGELTRDIERPLPGDVVAGGGRAALRSPASRHDLASKRSAYFQDVFASRGVDSAKEKIRRETMILAEVRTNVIIEDELGFINGLSHHLASRYHRSVSSIAVTLHHSSCMLFGGTFDKAYVMTISAIPCELQPATNKRNAAVVQGFMTEILGIPPCRGLLRFVPVAEECWAFDSRTVSGEMDDVERSSSESATAVPDKEKPGSPRSARKRISMKSLSGFKTAAANNGPNPAELTPPASAGEAPLIPPLQALPASPGTGSPSPSPLLPPTASLEKRARRTKSFVAGIFNRS